MHIESNSAYTPPLYTRATDKAANEDAEQTSPPSGSQETATADTAKAAAVTGVTGSNLSKEMVDQLMKAAQEAGAVPFTETERTLLDMNKERLDEALSDPKKARKYADSFRYIILIPGNGLQFPSNGSSDEVWERFRLKSNLQMSRMNHLAQERSTSIDKLRSEGRTDIEIIVSMLDFEANAPSRYGSDAIAYDQPNNVFNNQSYAQFSGEMRDYLTQQIKESSTQSVSTTQETNASNTDTEKYDGPLPIGVRHRLDEIASNPGDAEEEAKLIGTAGEFPRVLKSLLGTDYDKMHSDMAKMEQVREQRAAYYDSLKAQGLPPAKIFAKVLEFNANLPSSYDDTLGWSETGRGNGMSYSEFNKAEFDYLQNLINQGKSATASTKSTDSTKVAG